MPKKITLLFVLLIMFSCEEEQVLPADEFTVMVESTADVACGLPLVRFLDREEEVAAITTLEALTYTAYQLESALNVAGNKLIIEFGEVTTEDIIPCNTLGTGYPSIGVISARLAD